MTDTPTMHHDDFRVAYWCVQSSDDPRKTKMRGESIDVAIKVGGDPKTISMATFSNTRKITAGEELCVLLRRSRVRLLMCLGKLTRSRSSHRRSELRRARTKALRSTIVHNTTMHSLIRDMRKIM